MEHQFSKVSVVIPVYNRLYELERAIKSVLSQTWQNFEIIVVDDGSEYNIKSICEVFNDSRIRYLRNLEHKNANVARNRGIREAEGEFIAMLDSDDEYMPSHLSRRIKKIGEWSCDGIFGSAFVNNGTEKTLRLSRPCLSNELMINYLLSDGFAPTPSHFYKRDAAMQILWNEEMERNQDFDFSVRFSERFKFLSDYEPTVIINWDRREKRNVNYDASIKFIDKHKDQINVRVYNFYHRTMFAHVQTNLIIDKKVEKHYLRNSYRYIYAVTFSEFLFVHKVKRVFYGLVFLKFIFLHVLFFVKVILGMEKYRQVND